MPETKAESTFLQLLLQRLGWHLKPSPVRPPARLSRQLSFLIRGILVAVFVVVYLYTVPMVKQKVFEIERNSARLALNNVYEIANSMYAGVEQFREQALDGHKTSLRTVVELSLSLLQNRIEAAERADLNLSDAETQAFRELRQLTFGNNDYIWVVDYDIHVKAHPDPRFDNKHAPQSLSPQESATLERLVRQARRDGSGFYHYRWPRLDGPDQLDKVSYVRSVPELGIVIGAGVYLDDLEKQVQERKARALRDLRKALADIKIARTGYLYVFDSRGYMLSHPNDNLDGIRFISHQNPMSGEPIYQELMQVADTGKELHYRWDKPDDPNNYAYEKLSLVRYIEGFDWYICSSVYLDELQSSSELLSNRIMILAGLTMLATLLISNFFVNRITRPLERLAETAVRVRQGDLSARTGLRRDDEIGLLASGFDAMVERLGNNIDTLDAEVRQRTEELLASHNQAQRMSAVGQLAGGLAHDFNNLLSIVQGNLVIARERYGQQHPDLDLLLAPAERAARRSADITHRLLSFARRQPLQVKPVEVQRLLDDAVQLLDSSFTGRHRLSYQPDTSLNDCYARVDSGLLENALVNLGLNARDAMPDGGCLTLTASTVRFSDIERPQQRFDEHVADGLYLRVGFRDQGTGFTEEALNKALEPFFTTKPGQLNSGLGLSMVFGFVKQSSGYVSFDNHPDGGAEVVLLLPVCDQEEPVAAGTVTESADEASEFAGKLFLLVEDDVDVRQVVCQQMTSLGIQVVEAEDADEALALIETLQQSSTPLTGLLTDVMMPGSLQGPQLAARLRPRMPELLILLMSGYALGAGADKSALVDDSGVVDWPLIRKPFDRHQLIVALRQAAKVMPASDNPVARQNMESE